SSLSMDLRQCLILISGHLTRRPNLAALAESAVSFQMKISHSVAHVNGLCGARTWGIASAGEQAAAAPEKGSSSLSEICHVLVTLRERRVLLCTAALFGVGLPGAGPGLLRRWRTWAAMSSA